MRCHKCSYSANPIFVMILMIHVILSDFYNFSITHFNGWIIFGCLFCSHFQSYAKLEMRLSKSSFAVRQKCLYPCFATKDCKNPQDYRICVHCVISYKCTRFALEYRTRLSMQWKRERSKKMFVCCMTRLYMCQRGHRYCRKFFAALWNLLMVGWRLKRFNRNGHKSRVQPKIKNQVKKSQETLHSIHIS